MKTLSKIRFWGLSEILQHRIGPSCLQFCRAHQTVSTRIASDSVNEMQWRKIFWERTRAERKIDEKWRQRSLFELEYLQVAEVLEPYPNDCSMQNWTGYNLVQSFLWKSLMERERSRKVDEIPISKFDFSKASLTFPSEVELWMMTFWRGFVEKIKLFLMALRSPLGVEE